MTDGVTRLRLNERESIGIASAQWASAGLAEIDEELLERALLGVAEGIGAVERALAHGNAEALADEGRRLACLSAALHLAVLEHVALALCEVALRGDGVAAQAVGARLVRVGDASLAAAIERAVNPG